MAKAFGYLLPATADTAAPTASFTYPAELTPVNPVDPRRRRSGARRSAGLATAHRPGRPAGSEGRHGRDRGHRRDRSDRARRLGRRPGATGPAGPKGDKGEKGDKGDTPNVSIACTLAGDGRSITCTISALPPTTKQATLKGTARLAGTKKARSWSGKNRVKVKLRSSKRLQRAPKVVVKVGKAKSRTVTVKR